MRRLLISVCVIVLVSACKKAEDTVTDCQEQLFGSWGVIYERSINPDFTDWGGDPAMTVEVSLDTTNTRVIPI